MTDSEIQISSSEFQKAIQSLQVAIDLLNKNLLQASQDIELHKALRDACIQRFEFCVELGWKVSMKILGLEVKAPNPAIREMARNNLIEDPQIWFDLLIARNKTSHTYAEDIAKEVYQIVIQAMPHFLELHRQMKVISK